MPTLPHANKQRSRWRYRYFKDRLVRRSMAIGGSAVIIAILLIFVYLLTVVIPLFRSAHLDVEGAYTLPMTSGSQWLYLAMEEQNEIAMGVSDQGVATFFRVASGDTIASQALPVPAGVTLSAHYVGDEATGLLAFGLSDGTALVVKHVYRASYPGGKRVITPALEFPLGEQPLVLAEDGVAPRLIAAQVDNGGGSVAAILSDGSGVLLDVAVEENFLTGEKSVTRRQAALPQSAYAPDYLLMDKNRRLLYIANQQGQIDVIRIANKTKPLLQVQNRVIAAGERLTQLRFLTGDISLLAGTSSGKIHQLFLVKQEDGQRLLTRVRSFAEQTQPITAIAVEQRRRGFIAADSGGHVGIYHSTAQRTLLVEPLVDSEPLAMALSPRADHLLIVDAKAQVRHWHIDNEHPEVSFHSLWQQVWYEGYEQAEYLWQSSSASNDFEPKFSLTPLSFGTLKAAFYAMVLAAPLAIFGAIYTAYFMAPRLRNVVKPTVEVMEALPTVILGFLAGLWLAPFVEEHLISVVILCLLIPSAMLLFAWLWHMLSQRWGFTFADGWQPLLLVPVVVAVTWLVLSNDHSIELWLFDGDIRRWLTVELGIAFDQRNSIVVGLAMGFAVIPTIFSIAEDAIYSVPRHLTFGSLALGATRWQTLTKVVLLTASPGIFSALMIGFGRAVGETMIVLMATGNTAIMDFSIFQGMRTLAANIAVELPESEVASTHYRILFLAALVLFLFTFAVNTVADLVRQRLRLRYSTL